VAVRLAIAGNYCHKLPHDSPRLASIEMDGDAIVVSIPDVDGKLATTDDKPVEGFAIAGQDRKWKPRRRESSAGTK
jgi:hypothetical protein